MDLGGGGLCCPRPAVLGSSSSLRDKALGICTHDLYLPLSPQATYVLLALAWVFVPIYISSEVSGGPGLQSLT